MTPQLTLATRQAVAAIFQTVALGSTTFRLYRRHKQKNLWWDDYWALVAFLLDIAYCTTFALRQQTHGDAQITPGERQRRIASFWISGTLPPLIVWFSRISICLSISRIDMQRTVVRVRLGLYVLMVAFGLVGGAMLVQKIWICARSTAWHYTHNIQCLVGKTTGYISLIGDLLADSTLTIISLNFLWRVRMRRSQRRLLSLISVANILSSLAGIAYGVVVFRADELGSARGLIIGLVVQIKVATTLTVCNLLVVVTYLYARFWRTFEESDSETDEAPATRRHSNLPDGRTTKQSTVPRNTILILTELNSDGSIIPWSQQGRMSSTLMTWAGSERAWVPRAPRPALINSRTTQQTSSLPPHLEVNVQLPPLSRVLSEPSSSRPAGASREVETVSMG